MPVPPTGGGLQLGYTRRTLEGIARVQGIGLFTGTTATLTLRPISDLPGHRGVVFRRTDLPGAPLIPATIANVISEQRRTVLQASSARVETVEHILSALAGMGITDALIDLDAAEVPIADGSAAPFVAAINAARILPLATEPGPAPVDITHPLTVGEKGAQIDAFPTPPASPGPGGPGLHLTYRLDYGPGSPIPPQEASIFIPLGADPAVYCSQIAPARTFSTLADAQAMRQAGLFTQFEPKDLLVIGPQGPIDNTLRFANEPARHKLLDLIGDLSLAGRPAIGRIVATRTGHALNHEMARALASLA